MSTPFRVCVAAVALSASVFAGTVALARSAKQSGRGSRAASPVVQIAAGDDYTCARSSDGTVRCWGSGEHGTLGDGELRHGMTCDGDDFTPRPVLVAGLSGAVEVAASTTHACARVENGTVRCWGYDGNGELGDRTTHDALAPVEVVGLRDAVELALGGHHSCARLSDGSVRCWGDDVYGQLGDGGVATQRAPVAVVDLQGVVELAAGASHTCARLADRTVWCWGQNTHGQLGDGVSTHGPVCRVRDDCSSRPVAVSGVTNAIALSAAGNHTCAVLDDRTVTCWGGDALGREGPSTPVAVAELADVVEVALSPRHACARTSSGSVQCWGNNSSGQLGDGTTTRRELPVRVARLSGVEELATGDRHTCARMADGTVRCWGDNLCGQLGDAAAGARTRPSRSVVF